MAFLRTLADDVLLEIMQYLRISDILALRKTCRNLCRISKTKHAWLVILQQESQSRRLPLPIYHEPLDVLSGDQIERLLLHVLRLQHRMDSKKGPLSAVSLHRPRPVTWVQVVQGRWLLAASSDSSTSVLSLWSLSSILSSCGNLLPPVPLAEAYLGGPVANGLVTVDNGEIFIALDIRSPGPWTEILTLSRLDSPDSLVFARVVRLSGVSRIRCMDAQYLGFALRDEISIPHLVDWRHGTFIQLAEKPSLTGGCIAMARSGNLVAAVSPGKLELYIMEGPSHDRPLRIHKWGVSSYIGFATLAFDTPHDVWHHGTHHLPARTLRLCISFEKGIYAYELRVTSDQPEILEDFHEIWQRKPERFSDFSYPKFGLSPTMLTWYNAPQRRCRPVSFMISQVFATSAEESPDIPTPPPYEFYDANMPALYCFGVHDYDETRGVLVIGNSFGELVVYDFSGTDPKELESCFKTLRLPPVSDREVMPKTPIPTCAAVPYPYSRSFHPTREERSSVIASWRPYQPKNPPDGWTTNLLPDDYAEHEYWAPWTKYFACVSSCAWKAEHAQYFLGTQQPVMSLEGYEDLAVHRAGGLLFFRYDELGTLLVTHDNNYSVDDIVRIDTGEMTVPLVTASAGDSTPSNVRKRFKCMHMWEWSEFGRNRWQELKDRGGEVDASWLDKRPEKSKDWTTLYC